MNASSSFLEKWKAQRAAQQRQDRLAQRRSERKAEAKARVHAENVRRQIAERAQAERVEENARRAQALDLLEQLQVQRKQERRLSEQNAEALAETREKINAIRRQERQKENTLPRERSGGRLGNREVERQIRAKGRADVSRPKGSEGSDSLRRLERVDRERPGSDGKDASNERIAERRKAKRLEERSQLRLLRQREDLRRRQIVERRDDRPLATPQLERSKPDSGRRRERLLQKVQTVFRQAVQSVWRSTKRQQPGGEARAAEIKKTRREQIQREIRRAQMLQERRLQREQNAAGQQRLGAMRKQELLRRVREQSAVVSNQPRRGERMRPARQTRQAELLGTRRAEGLSWLSTAAQRIVDQHGKTVHLRGVSVAGLDAVSSVQTMHSELALDEQNLSILTDLWGINVVRLPFHALTILKGNESLRAQEFLAGLDDLVASISDSGAYTLLAMKAPGTDPLSDLPGGDAFTCWQLLAARYQQVPAVLFEVYSSPFPLAEGWMDVAHLLVGTIRREHPASLCFLGGCGGGSSLAGLPLCFETGEPVHNVVNTVRIPEQGALTGFDPAFLTFVRTHPVAVTEWTHSGLDLGQASELGARLFSRYGLSWMACHWNAEPRLVDDAGRHRFGETRFGMIARRALAVSLRPWSV